MLLGLVARQRKTIPRHFGRLLSLTLKQLRAAATKYENKKTFAIVGIVLFTIHTLVVYQSGCSIFRVIPYMHQPLVIFSSFMKIRYVTISLYSLFIYITFLSSLLGIYVSIRIIQLILINRVLNIFKFIIADTALIAISIFMIIASFFYFFANAFRGVG
jgi:hypothetical protein